MTELPWNLKAVAETRKSRERRRPTRGGDIIGQVSPVIVVPGIVHKDALEGWSPGIHPTNRLINSLRISCNWLCLYTERERAGVAH